MAPKTLSPNSAGHTSVTLFDGVKGPEVGHYPGLSRWALKAAQVTVKLGRRET